MSISIRGTSTGPNSNASSTSINLPSGIQVNDVSIIAFIFTVSNLSSLPTLTPPTGWTVLVNNAGLVVCYRVYQSGDPTTGISCSSTQSEYWESLCISYTGLDTANPIDSYNSYFNISQYVSTGYANNLFRAPSIIPNYNSSQLLCIYGEDGSPSHSITCPGGLTSRVSTGAGPNLLMADKGLTDGSATGNIDATSGSGSQYLHSGIQIALKASGASASTPAIGYPNISGFYNGCGSFSSFVLPLQLLNVQNGDIVVFIGCAEDAVDVNSAPSGYSVIENTAGMMAYWHLWSTGDSLSPSFGFSGSSGFFNVDVIIIRGVGMVYGLAVDQTNFVASSSGSATSTSLTPINATELLILAYGVCTHSSGSWSGLTSGPTWEDKLTVGPGAYVGWIQPAVSPTGAFSATYSASGAGGVVAILIKAITSITRNLTTTGAVVSAVSTPVLAITRPLASSSAVISAVATPNLVVQRTLATLATVMSTTSGIDLLLNAILDLVTTCAAQSQTSSPVLGVTRPLNSSMAVQTQTSAVTLAVLRVLTATLAVGTQTPDITLKVLRNLATTIVAQSAVSAPVLAMVRRLVTAAAAGTATSATTLAVLRVLATAIAAQTSTPDVDLTIGGAIYLLATTCAALTRTSDIDLVLTFYESLLAKAKRFYEPISAADLEAAALQWIVAEEDKEANQ